MADGVAPSLEIRILTSDRPDGSCVVLIAAPDNRGGLGRFLSPSTGEQLDAAIAALDAGQMDTKSTRAFGEALFGALIRDEIKSVYDGSVGGPEPVGLRLLINDRDAARIPWELLANPAEPAPFATLHRLVRGFQTPGGARPLLVEPPLRILLAESSPIGIQRLPSQLEIKDIREALKPVEAWGRISVEVLENATEDLLQNALREAKEAKRPRPIHVVHWIGHGAIDPTTNEAALVFEREDGGTRLVNGRQLVQILSGYDIRLVFLNACHSATQPGGIPQARGSTSLELTGGVATALLESGIPAVIGMQATVRDDRARQFARSFYQSLADGTPIDRAILEARQRIRTGASGPDADIGIPILYLREGPGQLLHKPTRNPVSKVLDRAGIFGKGARSVATVLGGAIVTALFFWSLDLVGSAIRGPRELAQEFNVVVSEFQSQGGAASTVETAKSLSNSLYEVLNTELEELGDLRVDMMSPAEARQVSGNTPEERAQNAANFARETHAHMVIYGVLDSTGTSLQPEFYIGPTALTGAEELAGAFKLGTPIRTTAPSGSLAAGSELRRNLEERTSAVTKFVGGLTWFSTGKFETAESRFESAIQDKGWEDRDGKEVVYLFYGTSAALLGRLDKARAAYQEALSRNTGYGRAMIGLAEVQYHQSSHLCKLDKIDADGVRASRDQFRSALAAPDQPPLSNVAAKGHFGIGRADYCLSQAGVENAWEDADRELTTVIAEYEAGNKGVQDLAAEAHFLMASVRLPAVANPDKTSSYRAAVEEYRKAIELSLHDARKALFYDAIGWVMERLGDTDEAGRAYQQAIDLAPDDAAKDFYRKHLQQIGAAAPSAAGSGG